MGVLDADVNEDRSVIRCRIVSPFEVAYGEVASETDPAVLRVPLKVQEGAGGGYTWVTCGGCDMGWQVPHYAA